MIRANAKTRAKGSSAGKKRPVPVGRFMAVDPRVCHGELTFRRPRVPVETILRYLAKGYTLDYLHKSWPEVRPEAVQEAVEHAAGLLAQQYRLEKS